MPETPGSADQTREPGQIQTRGRLARGLRTARSGSAIAVIGIYAFLIILILASRLIKPSFGSLAFVSTILSLSIYTAVVAFGQYVCVLIGGLDLSIPGMMALAGVLLTGMTQGVNSSLIWALPLLLLIGAGIGAINGLGIALLRVAPVVMTLAMNVILSGVVLVYTGGTPHGSAPSLVRDLLQQRTFGIPNPVILLIGFSVVAIFVINATSFGRRLYTIGSNPQVARLSGVPVNRSTVAVYALSGVCSALGGILLTGYGNQSYLGMGDPYLLLSIAAVVIGGASILGGSGLYLGVLGGAVILTTITTILSGTSIPQAVRQIILAIAIVVAVLVARQRDR